VRQAHPTVNDELQREFDKHQVQNKHLAIIQEQNNLANSILID
jgi:hypothetical protein